MIMKINFDFHFHVHIQQGESSSCVQNAIADTSESIYFSIYFEKQIKCLSSQGRFSTCQNYRTAIRSFLNFRQGQDVRLCDVTSKLIGEYEYWLKSVGVSMGTLSCYLRSLRAVYNKAVMEELVEDKRPFKKCFTGYPKSDKRSITLEEIFRLKALDLKNKGHVEMVRDIFLFCIYACGMPFVDVAFLRKDQINNEDYLTYYRHKTHQRIRFRLLPCAKDIVERYSTSDSEYVFPFLTESEPEKAFKQYKKKLCYYNKLLKNLGTQVGIEHPLTSYVSRHTWASLAYEQNTEVSVISKALGHTSSDTTFVYIKGIDDHRLDKANFSIAQQILGGKEKCGK
jgi:integrase